MASKHWLDEFPEELLLHTCHHLDQQALSRLACVSKQFHRIAIPVLYSHLRLVGRGRGKYSGVMHLLPILWKMIQQPELAALVSSLAILGRIFDDLELDAQGPADEDLFTRLPLPRDFRNDPAYVATIEHTRNLFGNEGGGFWDTMESDSSETAAIALLLTRLPNLRRLELWLPARIWLLNGAIFDPSSRDDPNSSTFASLEEITLAGAESSGMDWIGFLNLPALRRIYAINVGPGDYERDATEDPTSLVTEFHFRECCLSAHELDFILSACKQLVTFVYELGEKEVEEKMAHRMESQEWVDCIQQVLLRHARGTLQNLCLTYRYWELHDFSTLGSVPLCTGQFMRLSFLKISAILIFGEQTVMFHDEDDEDDPDIPWNAEEAKRIHNGMIDAFPPRLQRLHITECMEIIKRERPTSLFTDVIRAAPLEGFSELVFVDAGPEKDSNGDMSLTSEVMEHATLIAAVCVQREFDFELAVQRHDYYDNRITLERGWGMEDEVRWNCEGKDPSEQTAYFWWNFKLKELDQITDNSNPEEYRKPLSHKHVKLT